MRSWHYRVLSLGVLLLCGALILGIAAFIVGWKITPSPDNLSVQAPTASMTLYDSQKRLLGVRGAIAMPQFSDFTDIPPLVVHAITAAEDQQFFDHPGINWRTIIRAALQNIKAGRVVQGGSTITQQLVKITFLTPERTWKRKYEELFIALKLERAFSKEQILTAYANRVYLGAGVQGFGAASRYYFNKEACALKPFEAALLAGLVQAPSRYCPYTNPSLAVQRAYYVLRVMRHLNYITDSEFDTAMQTPLQLNSSAFGDHRHNYFTDWVIDTIPLPEKPAALTVTTTVDMALQTMATQLLQETIEAHRASDHVTQAALVAMTRSGEIRALVGGVDYSRSAFNRATQARRQPGSIFKIFVFAHAFEKGATPEDVILDAPIHYDDWQPRNAMRTFEGEISLRYAFSHSLNTATLRLADEYNQEDIIALAHNMGIASTLPNVPSLSLGTGEVTLLELTASYAAFANNGYRVEPHGWRSVGNGHSLRSYYATAPPSRRVLSPTTVSTMNELLEDVVLWGSGYNVTLPFPVRGKTGTTQLSRDALFVGHSDDLIVGLWLGNDDDSPMKDDVGGAGIAATCWAEFMRRAHAILHP